MKAMAPFTGQARVIGLTGAPGVGKSTITGGAGGRLPGARAAGGRARGRPHVPVQRRGPARRPGADAGSRHRRGVFIRSMASRGPPRRAVLGDPAGAAGAGRGRLRRRPGRDRRGGPGRGRDRLPRRLDPGAGRAGMGDAIQAAKAGILEIGDVFVVNKSDQPGAQEAVRDLRTMIAMAQRGAGEWKPPIVTTAAASRRRHRRPGRQARRALVLAGRLRRARPQAPGPRPGGDLRDRTRRAAAADGRAARATPRSTRWPPGWLRVSSTLTPRPTNSSPWYPG